MCYVNPHDLLRPYGCAMSFIMFHVFDRCIGLVLHTWCVVLKHFPCLCKMAFLFVFIMERGGGWILVHKWGSGLYCFLYAILMYNLSVSVLSNWVKWCFNMHSNFFVMKLNACIWNRNWHQYYLLKCTRSDSLYSWFTYIAIYFFSRLLITFQFLYLI